MGKMPGVGDQAVRRLMTAAAAPRRRQADRAALIPAERHVGLAGHDHRGAPIGRRAAQIAGVMGIRGLRVGIARQPAAVKAERGYRRLADDLGAGVQQSSDDRGVLARHVALHDRRTVEHRNPSDADVVLDSHRPPSEWALGRPGDGAFPRPAVGRVLRSDRAATDVGARMLDRQHLVGQLIKAPETRERRPGRLGEGGQLIIGQHHAIRGGDALELLSRRRLDGHEDLRRTRNRCGARYRQADPPVT